MAATERRATMADEISYNMIERANLELDFFPVDQAEVILQVKGDTDPLTLQMIRDAVFPDFKASQKKINEYVKSLNGQIRSLSKNAMRLKGKKMVEGGNAKIESMLGDFKSDAQAAIVALEKEQKAKADKAEQSPSATEWAVSWTIAVLWSASKIPKALGELFEGDPVGMAAAAKDFIEALGDLKELFTKLSNQFETADTAKTKVQTQLKKMKTQKSISESDVKALEDSVDLFDAKVAGMEVQAKVLSKKINAAIASIPDEVNEKAIEDAQKTLQGNLEAIVDLSSAIKKAQAHLKTYRLKLGQARQAAKKESKSWLDLAGDALGWKDMLDVTSWTAAAKVIIEKKQEDAIDELMKEFGNVDNLIN
jgi:hypothetical protein